MKRGAASVFLSSVKAATGFASGLGAKRPPAGAAESGVPKRPAGFFSASVSLVGTESEGLALGTPNREVEVEGVTPKRPAPGVEIDAGVNRDP